MNGTTEYPQLDPSVDAAIVIPCYNEKDRLPPYLTRLCDAFARHPGISILVVDDGSKPEEVAGVQAAVDRLRARKAELAFHPLAAHRGKGSALRAGFLLAASRIVGFVDADGSVPAGECAKVLAALVDGDPDLVATIATRVKMLGKTIERRGSRHLVGRVFASIVSNLFAIPVYDSQCGCKFFRRAAVLPLLPRIESQTWLWDTQLLILLHQAGAGIHEIPVSWFEVPGSKISLLIDPIRMLSELLTFRRTLSRERSLS